MYLQDDHWWMNIAELLIVCNWFHLTGTVGVDVVDADGQTVLPRFSMQKGELRWHLEGAIIDGIFHDGHGSMWPWC